MQCSNDKHNFIQADVYTGGTLYRCDKCGLEAHAPMLSGMIFKEYFGSYIGGISHKWIPSDMRAEDIVSFAVSFGDLPIVTVRYDGNMMKVKNSINGWMSFPEGYFDERTIKLSDEDKKKIHEGLRSLNFDSFTTSPDLFRNFGAPGFCISHRFLCYFSNGKGFECLSPSSNDFGKLVTIVKDFVGLKREFVDGVVFEETTTPGIVASCCNKEVPDFFKYCPYCGELIIDNSVKCDIPYDKQATGWLCVECGSGNQFDYRFCGNCGVKRPW